jgi:predicted dehydrogenase
MQLKSTNKHRNPFRYGILGTAGIARTNWVSIHNTGNSVVSVVASRDVKRSRQFIKECQVKARFKNPPVALGSYEELIESPDVDAVYIPLPTGIRKEWVLRAAEAGKHVVCEKPCGLNYEDVKQMTDVCRRNHVQFMDGVMFMHNPRLDAIRKLLGDGKSVGKIKRIMSTFSFAGSGNFFQSNIRIHSKLEPAGCLGDLGWYCIRFSLWAMKWQLPRRVTGCILSERGAKNSPGTAPTDFSGELVFNDDTSAGFYNSFLAGIQQWTNVSGTNGSLRVPDFVHPWNVHVPAFEVNRTEHRIKCCTCKGRHSTSRAQAQDTNLFRNFTNQARSGKLNKEWPMMALKTQLVMDACLRSARNGGRPVSLSA